MNNWSCNLIFMHESFCFPICRWTFANTHTVNYKDWNNIHIQQENYKWGRRRETNQGTLLSTRRDVNQPLLAERWDKWAELLVINLIRYVLRAIVGERVSFMSSQRYYSLSLRMFWSLCVLYFVCSRVGLLHCLMNRIPICRPSHCQLCVVTAPVATKMIKTTAPIITIPIHPRVNQAL